MSGQLEYRFRQGNRSEYLAQYLLSALGLAVKVQREEDVGIDFHCTLAEKEKNLLRFFLPYNVQVKSLSVERITYGGFSKTRQWKRHEVEWLVRQTIPYFVAITDKEKGRLDLFHTVNRWILANDTTLPFIVTLRPRVSLSNGEIPNLIYIDLESAEVPLGALAHEAEIQLGEPIVSLTTEDTEDPSKLLRAASALQQFIKLDMENATRAAIGLKSVKWPSRWVTNEGPKNISTEDIWWNSPNEFTQLQEQALVPLAKSLGSTYRQSGELDKAQGLVDYLKRLLSPNESAAFERHLARINPTLGKEI